MVRTWEAVWSWEVEGGVASLFDGVSIHVPAFKLLLCWLKQDYRLQLATTGNGDALGCGEEDEWRGVGKGLRLGCRAGEQCCCRGELHGCGVVVVMPARSSALAAASWLRLRLGREPGASGWLGSWLDDAANSRVGAVEAGRNPDKPMQLQGSS